MTNALKELRAEGAWGAGCRVLAAILLPVALLLSHRNAPLIMVLIGLGGIAALRRQDLVRPVTIFAAILCAWAFLTTFWSPYEAASDWRLNVVLLLVLSVTAMASLGQLSGRILLWSGYITLLLLGVEAVTGGIIRDIVPPDNRPDKDDVATARGITCILLALPAILLWLWREGRRRVMAVGVVAAVWAAFSFGIFANTLVLVAGAAAAVAAYFAPRFVLKGLMLGVMAAFVLVLPAALLLPSTETLLTLEQGPVSWRMRLLIWKTVAEAAVQQPGFWFGHGIEAARVLGEQTGRVQLPGMVGTITAVPTHPHNVFLQVWHDLGLIGVVLSVLTVWAGAKQLFAVNMRRDLAAATAAFIVGVVVIASVDASLWTTWRVTAALFGAWLLYQTDRLMHQ